MAEKQFGKKRGHKAGDGGEGKQSKRQRKRAADMKKPYFTPKPSSSIQRIDVPLEDLMPQQRIDLIAELSEAILEDPTSAMTSSRTTIGHITKDADAQQHHHKHQQEQPQYQKTQSKMNKLLDLAALSTNGHDVVAARLALLSLLAIFQDILPSYRIRLPTEAEMSIRVTKETKQQWDYERKLLQSYQLYLQLLERTWEDGKWGYKSLMAGLDDTKKGKSGRGGGGGGSPTTLAATAILALSQLLQTCYNFNFRSNILQIVVRQANNRSSDEVRSSCCNALSTMFAKDVQGEASLEAVRRMAKMIKERQQHANRGNSSVHPDVLDTWLTLPLRVHEDEAVAARLAAQAKAKRARKSQQEKDMLEIEKELKEGDALVDKIDLAKNQADILHNITLTYFRVLKECGSDTDQKSGIDSNAKPTTSDLLPVALRGLSKFSHLIHMDVIVDLLAVLKELLKNVQYMPPDSAIYCILCALKTLRGPGRDVIPVDPKEYLIPLYSVLPRLGVSSLVSSLESVFGQSSAQYKSNSNADKTIDAAIQCLDHAFLQRRELSTSRLAAFLKRLTSTSLHCPPHSSTPILVSARQINLRYASSSKVDRMLDNEEDVVAEGMFAPDAEDPEHSNAHATSLWELSLLRYHIHPMVADHAAGMAESKLLNLPSEGPGKICSTMVRNAQEGYISQSVTLKRHPLDRSKSTEGKSMRKHRRNQNQVRFITPRRTGQWHLLPANSLIML